MPLPRIAAPIALLMMLSACSGIGDGNKPESIHIAQGASLESAASVKSFTCLTAPLNLIGTFSNGSIGDFSVRESARWSSDNEAIVKVSNLGDRVFPNDPASDEIYTRGGVLIPQSVGTATIRAEFFGLTASTTVNVLPSENLRIEPASARIAPDSFQTYSVVADLEGEQTTVTGITTLSFVTPNDEVATLGVQAGLTVVTGLEAGAPMSIQAEFEAPCATPPPLATVQVVDIPENGLRLDYEEGFGADLAELTSEFLRLRVMFGDLDGDGQMDADEVQDLSGQVGSTYGYDVDDDGRCELSAEAAGTTEMPNPPAPVTFGALFGSGVNLIAAVSDADSEDRDTLLCASFGASVDPDGTGPLTADPGVASNQLALTIVDRVLNDFSLSASVCETAVLDSCEPLTLEPLTPPNAFAASVEEGRVVRFQAEGLFAGDYVQKITRDVNWISSTPTIAGIVSGRSSSAGFTQTAGDVSEVEACETATVCTATITATFTKGTTETTDDVVKTVVLTLTPRPEQP